jgi:hypothetical protein
VDKKKVIECSDDSSQFIFFETVGKGSFSKVKPVERIWKSEDNQVLKSEYAMKVMQKGISTRQRCILPEQCDENDDKLGKIEMKLRSGDL